MTKGEKTFSHVKPVDDESNRKLLDNLMKRPIKPYRARPCALEKAAINWIDA